jgi:hypothetical protein
MSSPALPPIHPPSPSHTAASPSPEELVAIVAAVEVVWPRPVPEEQPVAPPAWRFSGRWWARPPAARRERPWLSLPS